MRCQALPSRARPDHPYHRIYDCLLPIAHYLEVVAQAPDKRRICLIGSATSVFPFVRPLLSGVIEDQLAQLRMIDQHNPCVRSLRIVPQLRRYPPNHLANQAACTPTPWHMISGAPYRDFHDFLFGFSHRHK